MNYKDQLEYIDQLVERFRNDLYDRALIDRLNRNWELTDSYISVDSETRCDFVHQNGKRCNRPIKNIFVAKNNTSMEIIKVGSTCLKKLLGIPKESKFKADEFYSHSKEINKKGKLLKSALQESEKLASLDNKELRIFSSHEKEMIIQKAINLTIIPSSTERLLSAGIPLSSSEYSYLYRNIKRLAKEHREKERLEREKEIRGKSLKKAQDERVSVQQENKFKGIQDEKRALLNKTSTKPNTTPNNPPYLFGKKGNTNIDIVLSDSLKKVFVESGIEKENIQSNEGGLLSLAKNLSNYYCDSKCTTQGNSEISLALIMQSIRKYYDLNSDEQLTLQKKIKEQIYIYFKNELSKKYDLDLRFNRQNGFSYYIK